MLNRNLITGKCYLDGIEITCETYMDVLQIYREKADFVNNLYDGKIEINDVPAEWQEEIQRRVNERNEALNEIEQQEIDSEEFYSMVEEVL